MLTQANIDALNAILQAVKDGRTDKEIAGTIGIKSKAVIPLFLNLARHIGVDIPKRQRMTTLMKELSELRKFKASVEAAQRTTTLLRPNAANGRLESVM